jgi:hypothetical protein
MLNLNDMYPVCSEKKIIMLLINNASTVGQTCDEIEINIFPCQKKMQITWSKKPVKVCKLNDKR